MDTRRSPRKTCARTKPGFGPQGLWLALWPVLWMYAEGAGLAAEPHRDGQAPVQAPPEPLDLPAGAPSLQPLPAQPGPEASVTVTAGSLDDWDRRLAHYEEYQTSLVRLSGRYGHSLPWRFLNYAAAGADLDVFSGLVHKTDVPPAIHETHARVGLGTLRLWLAARILDMPLPGGPHGRLQAGTWLRATAPTTTLVTDDARYPLVPWKRLVGPNADQAALLEMGGLWAGVGLWGMRAWAQLSWTPLVWAAVRGGPDRFLTTLALNLAGRPWWRPARGLSPRGVELLGDVLFFAGMNTPTYTDRVLAGAFGLGVRLWLGPLGLTAGVRYGLGSRLVAYGEWIGGLGATYQFR